MSAPPMPPPPSNPAENDGGRILAATMVVTVAALITYLARAYVRLIVDYFMTLAMALSISGEGVVWGSVVNGAGRHLGDIPLQKLGAGLKLNFVSQPIYLIAICVVKLTVGAMLLRIASVNFYKRLIISLMVFMALWTTLCVVTLLLQCTDIRALWDPTVPMNCWGEDTLHGLSYSNLAVSLFTDLAFALFIPVPMLWHLNVNRRTRLSLFAALGLGTFACAAAVVKIPYLVNYGKTGDWLWDSRDITIWTIVECNVGIVAANLPSLRPLFKSILGTTLRSGDKSARTPAGSRYWRQRSQGNDSTARSVVASRKDKAAVLDETSSDRAFNDTSYELGRAKVDGVQASSTRVYGTHAEAQSSEESVFGGATPARDGQGITMTTTTSVKEKSTQ
ncbi:hypothetical protein QBC34DRAFT_469259 [Podospora aff. communis PSN243]|uniref:Rhodopsin domain-containing protein n=1 Tax=Podospora aff. communis PSN243 TaxID=3040156 RepID=A0AAV9GF39_9PEZI|nr:hypothetical protein QBC34DRAFT_469259 [Podospora aff. communis PSN243]